MSNSPCVMVGRVEVVDEEEEEEEKEEEEEQEEEEGVFFCILVIVCIVWRFSLSLSSCSTFLNKLKSVGWE